jgi:class 3 adenylate cyclase/streptogramin lyase
MSESSQPAVRTFVIADVRGYTAFTQANGDEAGARLAGRFAEVTRACVEGADGHLLELRGDEALAVFDSPRSAVRAAVALERRLADEIRSDPSLPLRVGIGIDAGEAVPVEGGYRGTALNLAARLCSLAKAGEVLISEGVVLLARRVEDVDYVDQGRVRLKGMPEPVRYYRAQFELDLPDLPGAGGRRLTTPRLVAGLIGLVAVVAAVVVVTTRGGAHSAAVVIRPDSLAEIDVQTRQVVGDVSLHTAPGEMVSGGGALWVAEEASETVARVDPRTRVVFPVGLGIDPAALAFGVGSLWAYDPLGALAAQVSPSLNQDPTPTLFDLPACHTSLVPFAPRCVGGGIAAGAGRVWIGRVMGDDLFDQRVWRVDPHATPPFITHAIRNVPAAQLAYGAGSIWTTDAYGGELAQIDATTARLLDRWRKPAIGNSDQGLYNNTGLTYAFGSAWLVSRQGYLLQFGGVDSPIGSSGYQNDVQLSPGTYDVTAGDGYLWVTNNAGTVTQVNPNTLNVVKTYPLGHPAYGVAYTKNRVWVGVTS